jgi:hypothetical protein
MKHAQKLKDVLIELQSHRAIWGRPPKTWPGNALKTRENPSAGPAPDGPGPLVPPGLCMACIGDHSAILNRDWVAGEGAGNGDAIMNMGGTARNMRLNVGFPEHDSNERSGNHSMANIASVQTIVSGKAGDIPIPRPSVVISEVGRVTLPVPVGSVTHLMPPLIQSSRWADDSVV